MSATTKTRPADDKVDTKADDKVDTTTTDKSDDKPKVTDVEGKETAADKVLPSTDDLSDREVYRKGSQSEIDTAVEHERGLWTAQSDFPLAEYRDIPGDGTVVKPTELPTAEGLAEVGVSSPEQVADYLASVKIGPKVDDNRAVDGDRKVTE